MQFGQQGAGPVALFRGAGRDDLAQRGAVHPFGRRSTFGRAGDHPRHQEVLVAGVAGGERTLVVGLLGVVEFLQDPVPQFGQQRPDLHARDHHADQRRDPEQLVEVGRSAASAPGYCSLTATSRPSFQTPR